MYAKRTKWLFIGVMTIVLLVAFSHITHAATHPTPDRDVPAQGNPPADAPTIIRFVSDPATTTVDAAESGETLVTLSWTTVGMQPNQHLEIHYWRLNQWEPVFTPDQNITLSNSGEMQVPLFHTFEFEPPTYRLAIVAADTQLADQWILAIPYDLTGGTISEGETTDGTPTPPAIPKVEIEFFNPLQSSVDVAALTSSGVITPNDTSLPVEVTWNVNNRLPESNLIFEQLLEDGGVIRVDTYRPNLWVPSDGTGVIRPLIPSFDGPINLRVRVVDLIGGGTLAELDTTVKISGTGNRPVPSATPLPTNRPAATTAPAGTPAANAPVVTSAIASPNPVKRGEPLNITWTATNASAVAIYQLSYNASTNTWSRASSEPYANAQPASGTYRYFLATEERSALRFEVIALGLDGHTTASALTNIAEIYCEPAYYTTLGSYDGFCGMAQQETQAAYQKFEHGAMVWLNYFDIIIVVYDQGGWATFPDQYTEGDVINVGEPPAGLIAPHRGFGELWITNPQVKEGLGWATSIETAYSAHYQFFQSLRDPSLDFINLGWFDTSVVRLYAAGVKAWFPAYGPSWSVMNP